MNQTSIPNSEVKLSQTIGTHNLTELRKRLEEKMLLKTNEQAKMKSMSAKVETWDVYEETPDNYTEDEEIEIK